MATRKFWKGRNGSTNVEKGKQGFQPTTKGAHNIPTAGDTPVDSAAPVDPSTSQPDYQAMVEQVREIVNTHKPNALRIPKGMPDGGMRVSRDHYDRYMENHEGSVNDSSPMDVPDGGESMSKEQYDRYMEIQNGYGDGANRIAEHLVDE